MNETTDALAQYDFRSPSRLPNGLESSFVEWQKVFSKLSSERVGQHLPFEVEIGFKSVLSKASRDVLAAMPEEFVAFIFKLGPSASPCMLALPRPLLLVLVNGFLGETPGELPADRNLTHVEHGLSEVLAEELAVALTQAYVGEEAIVCQPAGYDTTPQRSRAFPRDSVAIVSEFSLAVGDGLEAQTCKFIFPYSIVELLPQGGAGAGCDSIEARRKLEAIVTTVPITLGVLLGTVDLKLSEITNLEVGDVIVLDQRATDPLLASVGEPRPGDPAATRPRFHVWPGKLGSRRACQIAQVE